MGVRLSLSFLDGMHLFEVLLRDVIGAEARSDPGGVIALHDCVPYSFEMTTRDLNDLPRNEWTGDVWKLIPILRQHRPEMRIDVLDCKPTGLVLLSGLEPADRRLANSYDRILSDWTDVTLAEYGLDRFYDQCDFVSAEADRSAGLTRFDHLRLDEAAAIDPKFVTP
jgi:hypothetical protein